jgi:hypothetical protein
MPDNAVYVQSKIKVAPTHNEHVARLQDVNALISQAVSAVFKAPVMVVSDSNLVGTFDVASNTLTSDSPAELPDIDGITLSVNDRILLVGQTDARRNGIYVVQQFGDDTTSPWELVRSADFFTDDDIFPNVKISVITGDTYADTVWQLITDEPTLSDDLEFTQIKSGGGSGSGDVNRFTYKITSTMTDGTTSSFAITHNLDDLYPLVNIISMDDQSDVLFNVIRTDKDTVTVSVTDPTHIQGLSFIVQILGVPGTTY